MSFEPAVTEHTVNKPNGNLFFFHPFSGPLSRVAGGTSTHPLALVQYRAASTNGEGNGQGRSDKEHSEQQIIVSTRMARRNMFLC